MRVKDAVGRFGEDLAAARLTAMRWQVVDRNWRCPAGELDIVALEGTGLRVVEVKTRSSLAFGDPLEAITPAKAERIRRVARAWMDEHRDVVWWAGVRYDVVAIVRLGSEGPTVVHHPDVF